MSYHTDIADKATDAIGIIVIGVMAMNGVTSYEPIAAIATMALGTKYYKHKMQKLE